MVMVEFFDKAALENICGALLCKPEKVIFVGSSRSKMERSMELYRTVLYSRGIFTELSCVAVSRNHLQAIVDKLEQIVEGCEDECVFDLTGGDDLYLVAVGIIMERYNDRIQCHRFNFLQDKIYDCDADGTVLDVKSFDISVSDNISIYNGEIVTSSYDGCFTYFWDFNADFLNDVRSMWEICKQNPKMWNAQIGTLGAVCDKLRMPSSLDVKFDQRDAQAAFSYDHIRYTCEPQLLCELQNLGLITSLYIDRTVSFRFKNEQVKKVLTVSGQILELFIASRLLSLRGEDGLHLYNDVKVGTVINWGQSENGDGIPTINEIDVIAMKGSIPVFISCKNGFFDANELYKLNTVADRFGNKYAKKVLVATDIDSLGSRGDYLISRMHDMGIRCITDLDQMQDTELDRILASLWKN